MLKMQDYRSLNDCIEMCDRVLRANTYPRLEQKFKFDASEFPFNTSENKFLDPLDCAAGYPKYNLVNGRANHPSSNSTAYAATWMSATSFYPSKTIAVQNFLPDAEVHVRNFVAMFGTIEICEIIEDEAPSCLAVVQYRSKTSAADALLAMPYCQVRGSNLVVHLLWNGPYENIDAITHSVIKSFKECAEKRVVCVGHLPKNIRVESILRKCERYGIVENIKVQPQEQGAFAYVVFRSAISAAIATYCLRNSTTSSAALMLGYSENGCPVLLGPVRVRPLDQYPVPLSAFDVRCICTRFIDYSRMKGLFINLQRKLPSNHFFRPGAPEYCVRIPTQQVKGVSLFMEVLLFDGNFLKNAEEITDTAYEYSNHKHLFRFSVDFGLHKPIMTHDDRISHPNPQYLRWNSFFILDLQICCPWGHSEPRLHPRIQGMNHFYSDLDSKVFEDDSLACSWFGDALRHTSCNLTITVTGNDDTQHRNKIKFLVAENLPFVRLVGSFEDLNTYQIPIHVHSDVQANLKN